jgi:hypothetical protein
MRRLRSLGGSCQHSIELVFVLSSPNRRFLEGIPEGSPTPPPSHPGVMVTGAVAGAAPDPPTPRARTTHEPPTVAASKPRGPLLHNGSRAVGCAARHAGNDCHTPWRYSCHEQAAPTRRGPRGQAEEEPRATRHHGEGAAGATGPLGRRLAPRRHHPPDRSRRGPGRPRGTRSCPTSRGRPPPSQLSRLDHQPRRDYCGKLIPGCTVARSSPIRG